jgi:hypothetical protein
LIFVFFPKKKEKAINAFNFLVAENRFVSAALLPTRMVKEPDSRTKRLLERAKLYREIERETSNSEVTDEPEKLKDK